MRIKNDSLFYIIAYNRECFQIISTFYSVFCYFTRHFSINFYLFSPIHIVFQMFLSIIKIAPLDQLLICNAIKPLLPFFRIIAVYSNLFSTFAPSLLPLSPANVQSQTSPSHNAYTPECSGPPAPANSQGIRHRIPRISV